MITFPNAKINIGLRITGRREDGYHYVESVMIPIPWRDILEIIPSDNKATTLTVTGRSVDCPPEKNIVMKSYRALNEVCPLPPVKIFLHKNIPDGAGLGGGSADGAFTLKMLNAMFELGLTDGKLAEVASRIGADCPFFIYNQPMIATGIGTDLSPIQLSLHGKWLVVVKPHDFVSTAEAYAGVTPCKSETILGHTVLTKEISNWMSAGVINDFEKSIFPSHPTICEVKRRLMDSGADYVSMSGSGAALYAIYGNDKLADRAYGLFDDCDRFKCRM